MTVNRLLDNGELQLSKMNEELFDGRKMAQLSYSAFDTWFKLKHKTLVNVTSSCFISFSPILLAVKILRLKGNFKIDWYDACSD